MSVTEPEPSGWLFTDTTNFVDCPRCKAVAGEYCKTPSGRKTNGGIPHTERGTALREHPRFEEIERRSTGHSISGTELVERIKAAAKKVVNKTG